MYRDEESSSSAVLVGPGQGEPIWFLNGRMTVKATAETTRGAYGLIESVIPPGFSPPMHVHHRDDESYYVLDGQLTVRCGDETYSATAGSVCVSCRATCPTRSSSRATSRHDGSRSQHRVAAKASSSTPVAQPNRTDCRPEPRSTSNCSSACPRRTETRSSGHRSPPEPQPEGRKASRRLTIRSTR